jgi:ATP-binding cassette, subfamily G (WHITE), member 2, PDR
MYRVNPLTYVVEGFLATTLADAPVHCLPKELLQFEAPAGQSCGEYVAPHITEHGGYLAGNNDTSSCSYCRMADSNAFLASKNLNFDNRWRNFGLVWAYCVFNIAAAVLFYWLMRVPKQRRASRKK